MAVSPSRISNWTRPGAKDAAQRTYASIRTALSRSTRLNSYDYEVFLQGSYANATNLRGDSDVDIVAMLRSTFIPDTKRLTLAEKQTYEQRRIRGTTTLADFRNGIHRALADYYGTDRVHGRNKCIRVDRNTTSVDADVVPAFQYRLYTSYPRSGTPHYIEGIQIRPRDGSPPIINYPKEHIANGQKKNQATNDRYKPAVRQVKQLANYAAELGRFSKGALPGYTLECMVFNVLNADFVADDVDRLRRVMAALHVLGPADYAARFLSCDRIHHLFKDDPGQHNEYAAKRVIDAMWEVL